MANRKLKSLKFPGIDDTYILDAGNVNYSDEETYEEGSVGEGLNALKEDIKDNYAKNDGYYDGMTVGNAEQIVGTVFEEDDTAYNYRTTGGSAEVGDRAYVESITGWSLVWNQLVTNGNFESTTGWRAWTPSLGSISASNNVLTHTITPSGSHYSYEYAIVHEFAFEQASHKHFVSVTVEPSVATQFYIDLGGTHKKSAQLTANAKNTVCCITDAYTASRSLTLYPSAVAVEGTSSMTMKYSNVFIVDLTAMFGSTIADYIYSLETAHAGDGVAWFKRYFPKPYYAYHPVGMEHVNTVAAKTVGFNQWDEEWENGGFDAQGNPISYAGYVRSKNFIPVFPNTSYYIGPASGTYYIYYYDANKAFISAITGVTARALTTPVDCYYMKFVNVSHNTYNHDISVFIHWDNSRDGDYEPYNLHTYPLADLTLRGIPKKDESGNLYFDGDRYLPDGTVERRYGIVDLGTLAWSYWSAESLFYASINGQKTSGSQLDLICTKYDVPATAPSAWAGLADKQIIRGTSNNIVYVKDSSYSDAATFKTAMSGVYLVYELATPTTEEADPYQYPMVVDNWGTEEFVDGLVESGDRDVAIPVGHETKYPPNLKDKLESAANNPDADGAYILTHDGGISAYTPLASNPTIQNIIARLEALEGGGE